VFGTAMHKDNSKLKVYAKIDLCPVEQIACSYTNTQRSYYRQAQLAEVMINQLRAIETKQGTLQLNKIAYTIPAASTLRYQYYWLDAAGAELNIFNEHVEEIHHYSECEAKLKLIVVEQYQAVQNFFLRHNLFSGLDTSGKKLYAAALQACLSSKPVKTNTVSQQETSILPLHYLSATDIQLGEQRLTRIPLSSLQTRLQANNKEIVIIQCNLSWPVILAVTK
jgi:uncharacterized protein YcfL